MKRTRALAASLAALIGGEVLGSNGKLVAMRGGAGPVASR